MTTGYRPRDRIVTIAAPVGEVVALADMKAHLRVTSSAENDLISGYTMAAVAAVEKYTQRLLSAREITLQLPCLPSGRLPLELPGGAVASVDSVLIDGVEFPGCLAFGHSPALLLPPSDWPSVEGVGYPVTVTYTAGYSVVPLDLIHAVKMIVGSMYEDRENATEAATNMVPISAEYLMGRHRVAPV